MVPLNFSAWVHQQIDKVFLGHLLNTSYVGIYSLGDKISQAFSFFSRPIMTTVKPDISKRLDAGELNIQNDITDFFNLFFHFSLFLVFSISIFSKEIIALLADAQYSDAYMILPFMLLSYMFAELTGMFQLKFVYKNKTAFFPIASFLSMTVNVFLNYMLIPQFKILGAAAAGVLSDFMTMIMCYVFAQRIHASNYHLKRNFGVALGICCIIFFIECFTAISFRMTFIKIAMIATYGVILVQYLLSTNHRVRGLKNFLISTVQARFA
jgi:O-antigen/teichoic acid export membrane protein